MKLKMLIASLLVFTSCVVDDLDNKLVKINKTNSSFYLITTNNPDLKEYENEIDFVGNFLGPVSKTTDAVVNTTWEKKISEGKTHKLEVFLVPAKIAQTLQKKELVKTKQNYQHFSFSIDDLNSVNWTLVIDTLNRTDYTVRLAKATDTIGIRYKDYINSPPNVKQ